MSITVILAAGEGSRMKSTLPKVLHEIAGRSMLAHVMAATSGRVAVVYSPKRAMIGEVAVKAGASAHIQEPALGTGHALLAAKEAYANGEDVIMLFGDVPLITAQSVALLRTSDADVCVLGYEAATPFGYGRLIIENNELLAIVEEKEATPDQRKIAFVNGGPMALKGATALKILELIDNNNATGEFYATDAIKIARKMGLKTQAIIISEDELFGVNDRAQLAHAEGLMQKRLRTAAMLKGVTLQAPDTVFFSYDTEIANDVTIEPHVVFGRGVKIETGAVIHAFSHLEGAIIGEKASIGPYARLRPGTELGVKAKVGNFVETKNAKIAAGAKLNHLSYIGDAIVGENANIGAGTITCNYDGYNKFKTVIGKGAFIGSNSSLVAPVTIADGAYVGSGSVITKNVPENALAVARGQQRVIDGWAEAFRAKKPNS
jgi:bifunctional UDP-N-acetylglucosamine pyrophosphorylase / glucosamine-1-phosphate N-acetyltransferase